MNLQADTAVEDGKELAGSDNSCKYIVVEGGHEHEQGI